MTVLIVVVLRFCFIASSQVVLKRNEKSVVLIFSLCLVYFEVRQVKKGFIWNFGKVICECWVGDRKD